MSRVVRCDRLLAGHKTVGILIQYASLASFIMAEWKIAGDITGCGAPGQSRYGQYARLGTGQWSGIDLKEF